jgi:hypothetical protein
MNDRVKRALRRLDVAISRVLVLSSYPYLDARSRSSR